MKTILMALLLVAPATLFAQVYTLDNYLANSELGTIQATDSLLPIGYDETGTDLVWDFTDIESPVIDTIYGSVNLSAPYPHAERFPSANLCRQSRIDASDYWFFSRQEGDTALWSLGNYSIGPSGTFLAVDSPGHQQKFPLSYESNWDYRTTSWYYFSSGDSTRRVSSTRIEGVATGVIATLTESTPVLVLRTTEIDTLFQTGLTVVGHMSTWTAYNPDFGIVARWDSTVNFFPRPYPSQSRILRTVYSRFNNSVRPASSYCAALKITAYPNPATDMVTLSMPRLSGQLAIIDPLGRQVIHQPVGGETSIDVTNLPNGVYSVNWRDGIITGTTRIVVGH